MVYIPDLSILPHAEFENDIVVAVGWLSSEYSFTTGNVSYDVLLRLKMFCASPAYRTFGLHTCNFCNNATGANVILVQGTNKFYQAPEMIVHYIQEHQYCPPSEFLEAVLRAAWSDNKPVMVLPKKNALPKNPWSSSATMTAMDFIQAYKKPDIITDERWQADLADKTLFFIDDEGQWGDERCRIMTELLKDPRYDRI